LNQKFSADQYRVFVNEKTRVAQNLKTLLGPIIKSKTFIRIWINPRSYWIKFSEVQQC